MRIVEMYILNIRYEQKKDNICHVSERTSDSTYIDTSRIRWGVNKINKNKKRYCSPEINRVDLILNLGINR